MHFKILKIRRLVALALPPILSFPVFSEERPSRAGRRGNDSSSTVDEMDIIRLKPGKYHSKSGGRERIS